MIGAFVYAWRVRRRVRALRKQKLEHMENFLALQEVGAIDIAHSNMAAAEKLARRIERPTGEPELLWQHS